MTETQFVRLSEALKEYEGNAAIVRQTIYNAVENLPSIEERRRVLTYKEGPGKDPLTDDLVEIGTLPLANHHTYISREFLDKLVKEEILAPKKETAKGRAASAGNYPGR